MNTKPFENSKPSNEFNKRVYKGSFPLLRPNGTQRSYQRNTSGNKGSIPRPVSWKSLALTFAVGGSLLGAYLYVKAKKDEEINKKIKGSVGKPAIGGPFTLVDHNGNAITDATFHGDFMLVYFGFTHCPDICPTELEKLADALNILEKRGWAQYVHPIFISVDPMRDSVARTREYVKEFHPRLLGLTGTPQQVERVCKAYRVYYSKANEGEGEDEDDDYLLDHSIILYLMNGQGELADYFGQTVDAQTMADRMEEHIREALGVQPPFWKRFFK